MKAAKLILMFALCVAFSNVGMYSADASADTLYFKVGAGYKIDETEIYDWTYENANVSDAAVFELGVRAGDGVSYGFRHVSNFSAGQPFNDQAEYTKNEFFVEYSFDLLEF